MYLKVLTGQLLREPVWNKPPLSDRISKEHNHILNVSRHFTCMSFAKREDA